MLGVAKIAVDKVIPGMRGSDLVEVVGIASRDTAKADAAARRLGLAKSYGSYEALLDDPDIDAIYNPLPNHLHVPWSIEAARRGKHVLCEKPVALSSAEARALLAARDRHAVLIEEAFMVWTHPQWRKSVEICRSGRLGKLQSYVGEFSYYNDDPANVRNVVEWGGGALMDIGCYLVITSRMLFGEEPTRVAGTIARDPASGVDILTSMAIEYPSGQAVGTCSMRMAAYQRVQMFGTQARLEVEIPFNAPPDRPCRLFVDDGRDVFGTGVETIEIPTCDQYRIQADEFARAVRSGAPAPYPLEMSVKNMEILEAIVRSAETGRWESLESEPQSSNPED
ncbi:MAG TPA: Gfo/Idh/MocA family oxidoreductase [Vicinamibacterales bacterium]|nr:Gfo/Idh/MocA family oxidoreductase [Vicinamibacterales bacterium]